MEVEYRYCDYDDVTEVTISRDDETLITMCPDQYEGRELWLRINGQDEGFGDGAHAIVTLSEAELDQFIADLQRARQGCFAGEWPRPEIVEAPVVDDEPKTHKFLFDPENRINSVEEARLTNKMVIPLGVTELLNLLESVNADDGDLIELHLPVGV